MKDAPAEAHRRIDRRTALGTIAGGTAAALAGCVREVRSVVNRDDPDQLSLTIKTVPADADRMPIQIATALADNLGEVGIDATVDPIAVDEIHRQVLVNHSFELVVLRRPGNTDPDFLYEALHSKFADEPGWQNPYGFTNMEVDDLLDRQRMWSGEQRRETVAELLAAVADQQPFVPICTPDDVRLVRTDGFSGWDPRLLDGRLGYLGLEANGDAPLDLIVTDSRVSQNLNPLAVEYRNRGIFVDLLYDSLGTVDEDGDVRPWLADSWTWNGQNATVTLRDGLRWHDDEPITAADVAFTYRFIDDTSLGEGDVRAPAPRYRGVSSLVEDVAIVGDRTVAFALSGSRSVTPRAFTVPILPRHVWSERTGPADFPGVDTPDGTTEAIVTDNVEPVGSGPYAFVDRTERERVVLERFPDHFTRRSGVDLPGAAAERLRVHVSPRSASAIETIRNGEADATVSVIESHHLDDLEESADVRRLETRSRTFYHLGFNARNAPLSNPYFRRVVARLLDKEWIVSETFDGHATPLATPVDEEWVPDELEWDGVDPSVPFFGEDGELDATGARAAFEEAGFRYDDSGRLIAGDS